MCSKLLIYRTRNYFLVEMFVGKHSTSLLYVYRCIFIVFLVAAVSFEFISVRTISELRTKYCSYSERVVIHCLLRKRQDALLMDYVVIVNLKELKGKGLF